MTFEDENLCEHGAVVCRVCGFDEGVASERAEIRSKLLDVVPEIPGQPDRVISFTRADWLAVVAHICPEQ